ncbi:MAG: hypothetical protein H7338_18140 [Candidatus Sericytochromatia bacterium]|nr:hypothetical protein [Candidatus Sericytochromatia bacterium]
MRKRYIWGALATLCATGMVVACTAVPGTQTGPSGVGASLHNQLLARTARTYDLARTPQKVHLDTLLTDAGLQLKVTDFDSTSGNKKNAGSLAIKAGDDTEVVESTATCLSAVGDEKPHEIAMVEDDWPVMDDHDNQCTVTDKATGNALFCRSDQEFQKYTITSGGETLTIVSNPDGTFSVDGTPAAALDAAAALIVASRVGSTASLASIGAIYGTLLERKKLLQIPMAVSMAGRSPQPTGFRAYCVSFFAPPLTDPNGSLAALLRKTLAVSCSNQNAGPTPGDPSELVRAIIALREKSL